MRSSKFKDLVRVFVKGGIVSSGDFLKILLVAEKLGAEFVHFGSRQDILFSAKEKSKAILDEAFGSIHTHYEVNTFHYQNIITSYVSLDILRSKQWLASHIYHYVLDSLDFRLTLRINVVDPSQSLVPLFTGNVNFIASNQENFWFVYLRFTRIRDAPMPYPMLVYTDDLVKIVKALEDIDALHNDWSFTQLFDHLSQNVKMNALPATENLALPEPDFPYYEGINRLPGGKYWLGLYWRDNCYRISILKAIMERCVQTEVGKVSLTPWKSFIIKGIFEKDLSGWEKLMGRFGMNLRHSSLELNWHLPALDQQAMDLKFFLVRELDKLDISTYGLTFSIKTLSDFIPFTSVVIEIAEDSEEELYNILYSKNFNPNLTDYKAYAENIPKTVLASLIAELSKLYFDHVSEETQMPSDKVKAIKEGMERNLYQCIHCQTIYDESYGDEDAGISPGTVFRQLPDSYACPTCGGKKEGYRKMILG